MILLGSQIFKPNIYSVLLWLRDDVGAGGVVQVILVATAVFQCPSGSSYDTIVAIGGVTVGTGVEIEDARLPAAVSPNGGAVAAFCDEIAVAASAPTKIEVEVVVAVVPVAHKGMPSLFGISRVINGT